MSPYCSLPYDVSLRFTTSAQKPTSYHPIIVHVITVAATAYNAGSPLSVWIKAEPRCLGVVVGLLNETSLVLFSLAFGYVIYWNAPP